MTIKFGDKTEFLDLGFLVNTTIFTNAEDRITRKLSKTGLSPETYARRHYVASGEFRSEFPNSNESGQSGGVVGTIWPLEGNVETDYFSIIAVEDNSSYICFIPSARNKKIIHETITLKKNEEYTTEAGFAYVPTVDCELSDGENKSAHSVIVCQNSTVTIKLKENGKVFRFQSIDADSTNLE